MSYTLNVHIDPKVFPSLKSSGNRLCVSRLVNSKCNVFLKTYDDYSDVKMIVFEDSFQIYDATKGAKVGGTVDPTTNSTGVETGQMATFTEAGVWDGVAENPAPNSSQFIAIQNKRKSTTFGISSLCDSQYTPIFMTEASDIQEVSFVPKRTFLLCFSPKYETGRSMSEDIKDAIMVEFPQGVDTRDVYYGTNGYWYIEGSPALTGTYSIATNSFKLSQKALSSTALPPVERSVNPYPPVEPKPIIRFAGKVKPNSYLISLVDDISAHFFIQSVKGRATVYDKLLFNGFAAQLSTDDLEYVCSHPSVLSIEEDGVMSVSTTITQTNAPWGLSRISQSEPLENRNDGSLDFEYTYEYGAVFPVDIYVVDTGVYTEHPQFGGRAEWGATFGSYGDKDGNGHGTHCAGIIGSSQFGVAKSAHIIAVKVMGDKGQGYTSDIVSGLNWVLKQANLTGRSSVVSMSIGGGSSTILDNTVASLARAGVHVVVAAGNSGIDASNSSPARAPTAITVAASDINDAFASFSNYGPVVDIIAPGVHILSTFIGDPTATAMLSGTSMACPHVSGFIADYLSRFDNLSPEDMKTKIKDLSLSGIITNVPNKTINKLLNAGSLANQRP